METFQTYVIPVCKAVVSSLLLVFLGIVIANSPHLITWAMTTILFIVVAVEASVNAIGHTIYMSENN